MSNNTDTRRTVRVRRIDQCESLANVLNNCLPVYGGAYLRTTDAVCYHDGHRALYARLLGDVKSSRAWLMS